MRLSLMVKEEARRLGRYAEILAKKIVLESGTDVEYVDVADMSATFLEEHAILDPVDKDEFEEFVEYVDYLVNNAKITVTLPKEKL